MMHDLYQRTKVTTLLNDAPLCRWDMFAKLVLLVLLPVITGVDLFFFSLLY